MVELSVSQIRELRDGFDRELTRRELLDEFGRELTNREKEQ